jgi:gamma-glutamyltranspeptidase / glutathione hydrolase
MDFLLPAPILAKTSAYELSWKKNCKFNSMSHLTMHYSTIKLSLIAAITLYAALLLAQPIVPFPYKMDKEVTTDSAMVVTAHPLATKVGIEILKKGGNAVDAAVAVQFALAVVYPQAGNIGGGGFLIYRSKSGITDAIDYREKAPAKATRNMYLDSLGNVNTKAIQYGALAAGVPGTVDGMWQVHKKYGKLPWYQLVQPATLLAEKGFQVTQQEAENLEEERNSFIMNNTVIPAFLKFERWQAGDWLIQKELAETLRRIEGEGRAGFYEGATAALIGHDMRLRGGLINEEDLINYKSVWRKPLEFDWMGKHIITMPPPSSGGIILQQLLKMVEPHPLKDFGFHSAAAVHLMTEAERRAYSDRAEHMGDPDFWKVPVKNLVDSLYLVQRMANFDPTKASVSQQIKAGQFPKTSEETTHYSIVDKEGNAVSVTTTLNDSYGCRMVVAGAGFILNNEMDDFSAKPGFPNIYGAIGGDANAIAPNKRPLSSMTPTIVTDKKRLSLVVGTPGGTTIPTSVFQTIVNVYAFGLPLREAIHQKRFHHQWLPDQIMIEEGALSEEVLTRLQGMGHSIVPRGPIGRVEGIMVLPSGQLQGVADTRGDDTAGGY